MPKPTTGIGDDETPAAVVIFHNVKQMTLVPIVTNVTYDLQKNRLGEKTGFYPAAGKIRRQKADHLLFYVNI